MQYMKLDQSPLSKLMAREDVNSKWKYGARIQFESLQASDQTLLQLNMKHAVTLPEPNDAVNG